LILSWCQGAGPDGRWREPGSIGGWPRVVGGGVRSRPSSDRGRPSRADGVRGRPGMSWGRPSQVGRWPAVEGLGLEVGRGVGRPEAV
jgi:hypothetical protein